MMDKVTLVTRSSGELQPFILKVREWTDDAKKFRRRAPYKRWDVHGYGPMTAQHQHTTKNTIQDKNSMHRECKIGQHRVQVHRIHRLHRP